MERPRLEYSSSNSLRVLPVAMLKESVIEILRYEAVTYVSVHMMCLTNIHTYIFLYQPENLLLDENGNLKITDFGLSALHNTTVDEATLTSSKLLHTSEFC